MSKRIHTIKGLFGQLLHYQDGVKIGESWSGLFQGSYDHYDANGQYAGYSDPGIVADLVHHDEHGSYVGETHSGLFDQKVHYDTQNPQLIDFRSCKSSGDAFLIATAMKYGLTVLTEENKTSSKKIPFVCSQMGVQCMSILELCEHEGWVF